MPEMLKRSEWGARSDSVGRFGKMPGPVSRIWAHHSVTSKGVTAKAAAKTLEDIGMSRFGVFSYSFAIHESGTVIEGAGWDFIGAHTANQNSSSYGFCFIGNYETDKLEPEQIVAFRWLVARGKRLGKINASATIDGHQKAAGAATVCPGRNVMAALPELREPYRQPKKYLVKGVKRKKRIVRGWRTAAALRAVWRARGFKVTIDRVEP